MLGIVCCRRCSELKILKFDLTRCINATIENMEDDDNLIIEEYKGGSFERAIDKLNLEQIKKILETPKESSECHTQHLEQKNIVTENEINSALFTVIELSSDDNITLIKQIICTLVKNGANINTRNYMGQNILSKCCSDQIHIVEFLINLGADANMLDHSLFTPFMNACYRGDIKNVKILAPITKNIDQRSKNGSTALILSSGHGYITIVDYLLNMGAEIHHKTIDRDDNALVLASWGGHVDVIKLLVEKGKMSVNIKGEDGLTALEWAERRGKPECAIYLTDQIDKNNSITKIALMKLMNVDICNVIMEFIFFKKERVF